MVYTGNIQIDSLIDTFTVTDLKEFIGIKESVNKPAIMTWEEEMKTIFRTRLLKEKLFKSI